MTGNLRRLLASLQFATVSAGQNFVRNLAVSLAGVLTMGLILVLVGGALVGTHMLDQVLRSQQEHASNIRIFIQDGVSLSSVENFRDRLARDPRVKSVRLETKDEAAKEASKDPSLRQGLQAVGSNPLPASLNLDLNNLADVGAIDQLAKQTAIVDRGADGSTNLATNYNPVVVDRLRTFITVLTIIAVVISVVLGLISLVIIMNTIRTAVFVRRREIEIMKLVGATDWFVRWPFLLEGMLGGVIAAAVAGVLIGVAYKPGVDFLTNRLPFLPLNYDGGYLAVLLAMLIVAGVALGALGSYLGVRRFLAA